PPAPRVACEAAGQVLVEIGVVDRLAVVDPLVIPEGALEPRAVLLPALLPRAGGEPEVLLVVAWAAAPRGGGELARVVEVQLLPALEEPLHLGVQPGPIHLDVWLAADSGDPGIDIVLPDVHQGAGRVATDHLCDAPLGLEGLPCHLVPPQGIQLASPARVHVERDLLLDVAQARDGLRPQAPVHPPILAVLDIQSRPLDPL